MKKLKIVENLEKLKNQSDFIMYCIEHNINNKKANLKELATITNRMNELLRRI